MFDKTSKTLTPEDVQQCARLLTPGLRPFFVSRIVGKARSATIRLQWRGKDVDEHRSYEEALSIVDRANDFELLAAKVVATYNAVFQQIRIDEEGGLVAAIRRGEETYTYYANETDPGQGPE